MDRIKSKPLPAVYKHLNTGDVPKVLREAIALYGTMEAPGEQNNPTILGWAGELGEYTGIAYSEDSIPWCGLFVAICVRRAGFTPVKLAVRASSWLNWGDPVEGPPCLGDVLVFTRQGGGHVGFYVGEDTDCYHVLGGNQSDAVTITRISKDRLIGACRSPWKNGKLDSVKRVFLVPGGKVSENEA